MTVGGALKGMMVTGIYARRLLTVPADGGKRGVLAQICHPVILRVVKIAANHTAILAFITDIQIYK